MEKRLLVILFITIAVFLAAKFSLGNLLLKEANKITMSGDSFDRLLSEKYVLVKGLIIDPATISSDHQKELERFLNYQRTAQEDLQRLLK